MVLPSANPTKCYWIENAESPLRDFRSSDKLPEETDVVIIGSGYTGASTAYWIHKVRDRTIMTHRLTDIDRSSVYRERSKAASDNSPRSERYMWGSYWAKW
jgi:thioredoxin reductase